ncbi:MAG: lysophospholipid acyltransferase family protein [Opitutales bacterium]|nr:lysophospholipid acyltransferase family protein [Opitutales bacterium]
MSSSGTPPPPPSPLLDFASWAGSSRSRRLAVSFLNLAEPLLRLRKLEATYQRLLQSGTNPDDFFDRALRTLNLQVNYSGADLQKIPATGPVVLLSNHPYGGADGIALGAALRRVRPDCRLLVNYLLARIEGIGPSIIQVDPFGGEGAAATNLRPIRDCMKWLKEGGLLATFPSGTVSHLHLPRFHVSDPPWAMNLGTIIRKSRATVVPVYFEGRNSNLFQALGLLHPRIRTLLLGRELLRMENRSVTFRVGNPITPARLEKFTDNRQLMDYLRLKTYILRNRELAEKTSFRFIRRNVPSSQAPIAPPEPVDALCAEIAALPEERCLVASGEHAVYFARAEEIPTLLREIGRLREVTFRAVGEGTGLARDLDRFDTQYLHLFLWNRARTEVVGAYRLGLTDDILRRDGPAGLYTRTLFHYKPGVLEGLSPAIELGRSFIVAAYQRKYTSLGLIWRGIGQFVARFPKYKILFGPVSISSEYKSLSRNLMVSFLREKTLNVQLSGQVRAKNPPRSRYFGRLDRSSFSRAVQDIEDVSALISEIEKEERGVPVLLRQYLKLNATMLSFNVDPDFANCVDGLVLVDLTKTDERTLRRYMGEDGANRFYAHHGLRPRSEAAATAL